MNSDDLNFLPELHKLWKFVRRIFHYSCILPVLFRLMRRDGWPAMCIHGDKQQKERDWVLGEFRSGNTTILVATDVAARGLDVDDVKFVINYDYPNNSEDYIHRIGKTFHLTAFMMIL